VSDKVNVALFTGQVPHERPIIFLCINFGTFFYQAFDNASVAVLTGEVQRGPSFLGWALLTGQVKCGTHIVGSCLLVGTPSNQ